MSAGHSFQSDAGTYPVLGVVSTGPVTETRAQRAIAAHAAELPPITALTKELFEEPVSYEWEVDPENLREEWIVFHCAAAGTFLNWRDRFDAWHDRLRAMFPDSWDFYRLNVVPHG
ncbi:MAG TPA: hypothetical protein VMP01_17090 [Pirellulaceae bacterium]|nr:hypothetical protein [Pirellulaceae bacterium]